MDLIESLDLGGLHVDPLATKRTKPAASAAGVPQEEGDSWRFIISDESVDLIGDVVHQAGLVPVSERLPAQVDHSGRVRDLIGHWLDIRREGSSTTAALHLFEKGVSPLADLVRTLLKARTRMAASIGFAPDYSKGGVELLKDTEGTITGLRYLRTKLLEVSVVVVPAQPLALSERAALAAHNVDARHLARLQDAEAARLLHLGHQMPRTVREARDRAQALIERARAACT